MNAINTIQKPEYILCEKSELANERDIQAKRKKRQGRKKNYDVFDIRKYSLGVREDWTKLRKIENVYIKTMSLY